MIGESAIADLVAALGLPPDAHVGRRVPKKLLIDNGAPTTADKRAINDGVEELIWLAVLKPNTIGVPDYRDDVREYLEIAVLQLILRAGAKMPRLIALTHRAVPYPVLLLVAQPKGINISAAHKRWSQGEAAPCRCRQHGRGSAAPAGSLRRQSGSRLRPPHAGRR